MRKAIFWDFYGTLTVARSMWTGCVLEALGPQAQRYGVTYEKLRPFLASGFPWDADGVPDVTGEAWWTDRFQRFTAASSARLSGTPKLL